ncbi:patatin-like phospholipase family protein [Actinomycetospora sp. TBRC 11914]|uniref:patatin-like phospholipase family protein n=1 Tax=Actinomycetospora sp. TBRC 11914 TaxID=2729387 RepID=UPI00145CC667|nr:patatin-like phospholipase family protein [Actinomycetospora sp. TBRC 11914]NMO93731.1 patatin-like phospholipase family protein [Actinomycetospora sp. TBRC 11914]
MTGVGAGEAPLGLVISGAAARGPYEAGAIAEIVRALPPERPLVLLGTSSGAITAGLLAQHAGEGREAGERVCEVWRDVHGVYTNPVLTLPGTGLALGARALGLPGHVTSVLDVAPLEDLARQRFDPAVVARVVGGPRVRSLGVAATVVPGRGVAARTRLFVAGEQPDVGEPLHATDVVATRVEAEHLLASAAIPVLFPPVWVPEPAAQRGWYIDGGVRLNAPLDAALRFGVGELLVVSGHSLDPAPVEVADGPQPDLDQAAAVSVRAVLTDALGDDVEALRRRNRTIRDLAGDREVAGHRRVPFRVVAPADGQLAGLARRAFDARARGPWDASWAIERLLTAGGGGIGRDELLSLVFFDPDYARAQIEQGRADARAVLAEDARE